MIFKLGMLFAALLMAMMAVFTNDDEHVEGWRYRLIALFVYTVLFAGLLTNVSPIRVTVPTAISTEQPKAAGETK